MKYNEIEEVLKNHGQNSAVEQLRAAVGDEALELTKGIRGDLDEATAVEQAREFFAEDINRWMTDGGDPDPQSLIGMRARYAKSWAFAQIIHNLLVADADEIEVPAVDPDTLVRICLANAELGTKLVEMIGSSQEAAHSAQMANAIETISKLLDAAKAPTLAAPHGHRKLAIWERLEAVMEELEEMRSAPAADPTVPGADAENEVLEEMRRVATVAQDNAKVCLELLKTGAENLCWMAQSIHQGHHTDEPGTWKECSKGVCGSMEHMLSQLGFDKDLGEIERVP
jgi:hypothetical protein